MDADLIDEYRIFVNLVVLGSSKPLFKRLRTKLALNLVQTVTFRSGVVGLYYRKAS
jgi:dihydrofolate reductase